MSVDDYPKPGVPVGPAVVGVYREGVFRLKIRIFHPHDSTKTLLDFLDRGSPRCEQSFKNCGMMRK
jgi:hypothetical protein